MWLRKLVSHLQRPTVRRGKHHELGRRGEDVAAQFFRKLGYSIVARNWSCPSGELDLICRTGDQIVYVEVKTGERADSQPELRVGHHKRRQILKVAAAHRRTLDDDPVVRFDIVAVVLPGGAESVVRHYENAFSSSDA